MTSPDERYRSIKYARQFLLSLLNPKETPRVPKDVREWAGRVLVHFPYDCEVRKLAEKCPNILRADALEMDNWE